MKTTLMSLFLLLFAITIFAQEESDTTQLKKERLEASIRLSASHRKMVAFTGAGMEASILFQDWMTDNFGATIVDKLTKSTATTFQLCYTKNDFSRNTPTPIKILYTYDKSNIVKKVEISGSWKDVVRLFIQYWERPYQLENTKRGELVWFNSFCDRVSISSTDGITAKISIIPNGINIYKF